MRSVQRWNNGGEYERALLPIGYIHATTRAIFGRLYGVEPDKLVSPATRAIVAADTLLLTVANQLGVEYTTRTWSSALLKFVAPELDWR